MKKFNPDDRPGRWTLSDSSSGSSNPGSASSSSSEGEETEQVVQGARILAQESTAFSSRVETGCFVWGRAMFTSRQLSIFAMPKCLTCQSVCKGILNCRWAAKPVNLWVFQVVQDFRLRHLACSSQHRPVNQAQQSSGAQSG